MGEVIRLYSAPGRLDALHPEKWWEELELIVWHFTGGAGSPGFEPVKDLGGCALSGREGIGWTVTLPRDCRDGAGQVYGYRHYEWDQRTGHAAKSRFKGRGNVNGRSIGVELANLGELIFRKGRWVSKPWLERSGRVVHLPRGREVFKASDGTHWEAFDADQLEAVRRLKATLDNLFPGVVHVRHQDIRSTKPDPGPALPWPIAA